MLHKESEEFWIDQGKTRDREVKATHNELIWIEL